MMTRLLYLLAAVTLATAVRAQVTYSGRGTVVDVNDDAISTGTMTLSDDGADLTVEFFVSTGHNFIPQTLVMYIDSEASGFADNAGFTDNADNPRIATSGLSGGGARAPITFPAGFTADYALTFETSQTHVFALRAGTTHDIVPPSIAQTKVITANGATITTVVPLSAIGNPRDLVFVTSYVNANTGARTDQSHTETIAGGNPGTNPVTFTSTATYRTSVVLPVSLTRFDAAATATGVALTWETAAERDNAGFAVERSRDGETWSEIAFVDGHGDTDAPISYAYRDAAAPAGPNYYRLRQVDYDGTAAYSDVVAVGGVPEAHGAADLAIVGAHPVRGATDVRNGGAADLDVAVLDATGRRVGAFAIAAGATYRLDVSALAAGTYVLRAGASARRLIVR